MVDRAGAAGTGAGGGVVSIEAAAGLAAGLKLSLAGVEPEAVGQESAAGLGVAAVGADAVEALQRGPARDLRVVGQQRLVAALGGMKIEAKALRVGEA